MSQAWWGMWKKAWSHQSLPLGAHNPENRQKVKMGLSVTGHTPSSTTYSGWNTDQSESQTAKALQGSFREDLQGQDHFHAIH